MQNEGVGLAHMYVLYYTTYYMYVYLASAHAHLKIVMRAPFPLSVGSSDTRCSRPMSAGGAFAPALREALARGSAEEGTAAAASAECGASAACSNHPGEVKGHGSPVPFNEFNSGRVSLHVSSPGVQPREKGVSH